MKQVLVLAVFSAIFTAACGASNTATTANQSTAANSTANTSTSANQNAAHKADDETPAAVKAAFAEASSITKQHKDLTASQISQIEKDAGAKIAEKDFHSYLAFTTAAGTRKQIGAATVVKAEGKEYVVVYENKDGMPYIKEIRGDGAPKDFLAQFAGKGHDDKIQIGADLKANGVSETTAKAIADAVRVDAMTMQTLYGKEHTH